MKKIMTGKNQTLRVSQKKIAQFLVGYTQFLDADGSLVQHENEQKDIEPKMSWKAIRKPILSCA